MRERLYCLQQSHFPLLPTLLLSFPRLQFAHDVRLQRYNCESGLFQRITPDLITFLSLHISQLYIKNAGYVQTN